MFRQLRFLGGAVGETAASPTGDTTLWVTEDILLQHTHTHTHTHSDTHTLTHTYVAERLQHTTFLIPNPPLSCQTQHTLISLRFSLFSSSISTPVTHLHSFPLLHLFDVFTFHFSPISLCGFPSFLPHFTPFLSFFFALSGWSATPAWVSVCVGVCVCVCVCVTASHLPSKHPVNEHQSAAFNPHTHTHTLQKLKLK